MPSSRSRLASVSPIARARRTGGVVKIGTVVEVDGARLLVDFPGNEAGPATARTTVPHGRVPRGAEVVLLFEEDDPARPIVMGILQPGAGAPRQAADAVVAEVDGRRMVIEGKDEVVLRCGEASITLRRNGRVIIRGAEVESRASGTNKVRGGSVRIN